MGLTEFCLLALATVAAIAASLAVWASKYRAARVMFWIAGLSFWSMGVMWSATSEGQSLLSQIIVSAIVGGFAAAGLTWALWEVRAKEGTEQPTRRAPEVSTPSPLVQRGPTLEAINKSKIDATGAQIPGDLPFQFGRADNNSLIDMPGIVVTKTDSGFTITPGNANRQFPAPTGEFVGMSTPELKRRIQATTSDLRTFQEDFDRDFFESDHKWPDDEKARNVSARYAALYSEKFAKATLSLASAALSRLGTIDSSEMSREARDGSGIVYHGKFVGPSPAAAAAAFLESLSSKLPSK